MNEPGRRGPMRALLIALVTVTFFGCAQAPSLPSGTGAAAGGVGTQPSSVPMLTPGSNNAPNVTLATTDASAGTTGGPCTGYGYDCKVVPCPGGAKTTVTAKVYDPAGKVPLYDIAVYVPNTALAPIATGRTCDNCATPVSGSPVTSALTDASGQFVLQDVPVGANIPLVFQVGKWRRLISIPEVKACQDNPFDDPTTFRLPRDQSEGNLPKIALGAGDADTLECLLRRIGIADSEFTNPDGPGRVNLFENDLGTTGGTTSYASGASFPLLSSLVDADAGASDAGVEDALSAYDIVVLSCQGTQSAGEAVTTAEKQGMKSFVDNGGRLFLSHYNYSWLRSDKKYTPSPFPAIATWGGAGGDGTYLVDTTFPRGSDMAEWLFNVGASTTEGQINLVNVKDPAASVVAGNAQQWIYQASMGTPYISANTPIELASTPAQQCGRVVQTGIHVSSGSADTHSPFPSGCVAADLSAQEKALEFLFFDLSSCVTDEAKPPLPPPVR